MDKSLIKGLAWVSVFLVLILLTRKEFKEKRYSPTSSSINTEVLHDHQYLQFVSPDCKDTFLIHSQGCPCLKDTI